MKQVFIFTFGVIALSAIGCETKEKVICPTVAEEAISVCRAKQRCLNVNTSTGVGIGFGFGLGPNTGSTVGVDVNRNNVDETYPNCIDRDLDEQKRAATDNDKTITKKPK